MGVSTDAVVFYGYCWDDEDEDEQVERLLKESWRDRAEPVEASTHCHSECPMLYVTVKVSERKAWRGCPVLLGSEFVAQTLDVPTMDTWRKLLLDWCKRHSVNLDNAKGPDWWLVSDSDF